MADDLKSNSKDDLPIRQHLVDTAVGFMLNPNVKARPDDAKISFLKNKGLTDSEITEAFNRVKYEPATAFVSNENKQLVNAYPLPHYRTPNPFWFHVRNYSSTFLSFAVAVYALQQFYKSYIEPWLFGTKFEKSELSILKEQLIELNKSISQLNSAVSSLEEAVNNQMDRSSLYDVESVPKSVRAIFDEISSVKGLLLNRFSFPAPPTIAGATVENKTQNGDSKAPPKVVTIPKWQLRNSELGKSDVDPKEQIEDIENSSSEFISLENSLCSVDDQKNEAEIAKNQEQGEESPEDKNGNSEECLENNLNVKDKTEDEDSKIAAQNEVKNTEEKALNDDSGFESHNYLSDSELIDLTSGPNKHHESAKNLE